MRSPEVLRRTAAAAGVVAAGVLIAVAILAAPWLVAAAVAGAFFLLLSVRIIRHQRLTAVLIFLIVLLAGSKFRSRDVGATLSGAVDSQVAYELAMFAALGWIVFLAITFPVKPVRRVPRTIPLGLVCYAVLAVVSTAWSPTPVLTLVRSLQLSILVAAAICLFYRTDPTTILQALLIALLVHCGTFIALAIAISGGWPQRLTTSGVSRFTWFAMHPSVIAMLMATAFLLLLASLLEGLPPTWNARRFAVLRIGGIVVFGALLLATRARADFLATLAAAGVMVVRRTRIRPDILAVAVLGGLAILGFAVTTFGGTDLVGRMLSDDWAGGAYLLRGQTSAGFLSLNGRTLLWKEMLPLVSARPVLGWGFESTRSVLLDVFFWAAYAHNALMQALMGLGVVGAGLLMTLFGSCFFVGSARNRGGSDASAFARSAVLGLAVYLGIQAVGSESFAGTPGFAALVAFLCMLSAADLRQEARATHGGAAPLGQPRALAW